MSRPILTLGILAFALSACGMETSTAPVAGHSTTAFEPRPVEYRDVVPRLTRAMTTEANVEDEF